MEEYPLNLRAANTVLEGRRGVEKILQGEDDRLVVVRLFFILQSLF